MLAHALDRRISLASIVVGALIIGSAAPAAENDRRDLRIEISPDGHEIVEFTARPDGGTVTANNSAVPYGDSPDWTNTIRRQVGSLQVADMNSNGLMDVVAGLYHSQSFPPYESWQNKIYFNIGGQLEDSPSWMSTDEVSTGDIQVGDINGNGHLDVFAANGGFAMAPSVIYFGGPGEPSTSPGWSSAEPGGAWNNYALLVDLDDNGWLDVVTANQGNSQNDPFRPMFVFKNNGGTLENSPSWQSAESSIQGFLAAGDYNDSGWRDIAVSKWANWETGIYANAGGTLETTPTWTTGLTGTDKGVAWADVNHNGHLDLVVGTNPTTLYTNDGDDLTVTWQADAPHFGPRDIRFTDITGNGYDDLVEVHFSNGHANIYLNNNGVLDEQPSWTFNSPGVGTAIALGDITGNGWPDLVVANSGDPSIFVFYHEGVTTECTGDLNEDDQVDVDDLFLLLAAWGPCDDPDDCPADLNNDGSVDIDDLFLLLANWGPCD